MALSFPSSPSLGQEYIDLNGKTWAFDGVKWNIQTTTTAKTFYGVKAVIESDPYLGTSLTAISFDSAPIDTDNFFNSLSPTQLIIPRTGYYRINLSILSGEEGSSNSYTFKLAENGTTIVEENVSRSQGAQFDEIRLLQAQSIIKLYGSEQSGNGQLLQGSFLEIHLVGYAFGGQLVPGYEFSGVKVEPQSDINVSITDTAIIWASADIQYNINANSAGGVYWSNTNSTRFTISTTGYYRIKGAFYTGTAGSADTYLVTLKKNGSTDLESITLGGSELVDLDSTYQFNTDDYLEIFVNNSENVGTISSTDTYFEITRLGV